MDSVHTFVLNPFDILRGKVQESVRASHPWFASWSKERTAIIASLGAFSLLCAGAGFGYYMSRPNKTKGCAECGEDSRQWDDDTPYALAHSGSYRLRLAKRNARKHIGRVKRVVTMGIGGDAVIGPQSQVIFPTVMAPRMERFDNIFDMAIAEDAPLLPVGDVKMSNGETTKIYPTITWMASTLVKRCV